MRTQKFVFILIAFALVLFACKDDKVENVKYNEVKIISFGFYVEDNVGFITKDYLVSDVKTNSINLDLPADIDKSSLIARFTTSNNVVVKVGSTTQVSGTTPNNFNYPVDYILCESPVNYSKYTVTIGKSPIWTLLPAFTTDSASSVVMKVSPLTNLPYLMFKKNRSETDAQRGFMIRFDGKDWVSMGDISDGRIGSYFDFTFDALGVPIASYADYTAKTTQAASVKSFNVSRWDVAGVLGLTSNKVSYNSICFSADGKLKLFSAVDGTNGPLLRRELCISTFDKGTWITNETMPGRGSDQVAYWPVSKVVGDSLYLGIFNPVTPNSISVYKYVKGVWTTLLKGWHDPAATGINVRDFDMDVTLGGKVYLAFVDNSTDGATAKQRIVIVQPETNSVSNVGVPFAGASGGLFNFDLALSPLGVPYFFYRNSSSFPTVVVFDEETQQWSVPKVLETFEAGDLNIAFAPDGTGYITYLKDRKIISYILQTSSSN